MPIYQNPLYNYNNNNYNTPIQYHTHHNNHNTHHNQHNNYYALIFHNLTNIQISKDEDNHN